MRYTQHSKNTPNRLTLAVVSLLSAMALTACGGGGGGGGSSTPSTGGGNNGSGNSGNNGSGNNPTQPVIDELVVTTLNDVVNAKDDVNSLREAVAYASKNGGTITFKDDLKGTITLKNQIDIVQSSKPFSIKGKGDDIKIDGNNKTRLFYINNSIVTLNDLVLQNASIPSNDKHTGGGAIWAYKSVLNLNNSKLQNNTSGKDMGGAIAVSNSTISIIGGEITGNTGYDGGAVYSGNNNILTINGTTFDNNACVSTAIYNRCYGGAIAHMGLNIDITGATFKNNKGGAVMNSNKKSGIMGGALYLSLNRKLDKNQPADMSKAGNATITDSKFINNVSDGKESWAGAIMIDTDILTEPNYTVTIKNSEFDGNVSKEYGGVFYLSQGNTVNITGSKFTNNRAKTGGVLDTAPRGGSVIVKDSEFKNNTATSGAGAMSLGSSIAPDIFEFDIDNVTFEGNTAKRSGGALEISGGFVLDKQKIRNSKFINNKADGVVNTTKVGEGGAIYAQHSSGFITLDNSTFSNNTANNNNGGIHSGSWNITDSTFTNNSVYSIGVAKLKMTNTSISGATDNKGNVIRCDSCLFKISDNTIGGGVAGNGGKKLQP